MDPADQWVLNPETGNYELRPQSGQRGGGAPTGTRAPQRGPHPDGTGHRGGPPRQRRAPGEETSRPAPPRDDAEHEHEDDEDPPPARRGAGRDGDLPAQRDRRAQRGRRKVKQKKKRGKKILMWVAGVLALLLVVGCTAAYLTYKRLNDNITKVDVPYDNPATSDAPVNILLIGSDQRTGDGNDGYGDRDSLGHAETTVLLHFSQEREHATALSIPRDLIVDIPECEVTRDGVTETIPGSQGVRFNESYGQQGRDPGCTWKTVQELTGVEINHFMLLDFNAVKTLSTAVGGVEVCLAKDIDDPKSHLKLSAGTHVIEGEEALAFVRTRDSVGHSSDLSRIQLQQQFLGSMARSLTSNGTLTDPGKLLDLADAATKALTVDTAIGDVQKLHELARDLGRVPVEDISFVTLPVKDNPAEEIAATVVLDRTKAEPLFRMIQEDISLTAEEDEEPAEEDDGAKNGDDKPEPAAIGEIQTEVFNGGDVPGAAQQTLDWLLGKGAVLATLGGNADAQETTVLLHTPDQAAQAATLADMMGMSDSAVKIRENAEPGRAMTLILGNDFSGPGVPIEAPAKKPENLESSTAEDAADTCAA
ncbi:LCP family protein [Streptomyces bohaiensis]|nr:LCP family protein [Streptomyces bohaiensis]